MKPWTETLFPQLLPAISGTSAVVTLVTHGLDLFAEDIDVIVEVLGGAWRP